MLYWYPYEGPLQPIYGAIFKDLIERGHEISIVTSFPHFRKGRSETWNEYRAKLFEKSEWSGTKLIRTYVYAPLFKNEKLSLFYRALNFISFNISSLFGALLYGGKFDLIFAPSSPPLTNGISAWIISLFKRCPVVYNVQDIYPDMAEKLGLIKNKYVISFLRLTEKLVYRLSQKIILISEGMRKNIISKGIPPEKTEVIPNFIDAQFIRPLPKKNRFSTKWGLTERFVVMYAGNIGLPHGTEVIIEAAEILKDDLGIFFCIVGRGEYRYAIEKYALEKSLDNIIFIPPQPEEETPYIWASASVSLVTYRSGLSEDSVPSKLLATISSGRPVIASIDKETEAHRIIKEAKCGICVEPENARDLAMAIKHLKENDTQRENMGKMGRNYVLRHFNRDMISEKYENLFYSLCRY